MLTLLLTAVGTLLAIFVADVVSRLILHERILTKAELRHALRSSLGSLSALVLPFLFLLLAAVGVWPLGIALWAVAGALLFALVAFGFIAAYRTTLTALQRVLVLGGEAALGLVVIAIQVLAKL